MRPLLKDISLFHGSKTSLVGKIYPGKRRKCDFGQAFYMGTKEISSIGICESGDNPTIYHLDLQLSNFNPDKIMVLTGDLWLYAVIAYRRLIREFDQTSFSEWLRNELDGYDMLIGPIADDRMAHAIGRFSRGDATDAGIIEALQTVGLGWQFAAKTDFACSQIEIVDEASLSIENIDKANMICQLERSKMREMVNDAISRNIDKGFRIRKMIEKIISGEINLENLVKAQKQKTSSLLEQIVNGELACREPSTLWDEIKTRNAKTITLS